MYLLPKPKKFSQSEGQLLLSHHTGITMTREVADTAHHAVIRLLEEIRYSTGLMLQVSVGEAKPGDIFLTVEPGLQVCYMVWKACARCLDSVAEAFLAAVLRMHRICCTGDIILIRQEGVSLSWRN